MTSQSFRKKIYKNKDQHTFLIISFEEGFSWIVLSQEVQWTSQSPLPCCHFHPCSLLMMIRLMMMMLLLLLPSHATFIYNSPKLLIRKKFIHYNSNIYDERKTNIYLLLQFFIFIDEIPLLRFWQATEYFSYLKYCKSKLNIISYIII